MGVTTRAVAAVGVGNGTALRVGTAIGVPEAGVVTAAWDDSAAAAAGAEVCTRIVSDPHARGFVHSRARAPKHVVCRER